MKVEDSKYSILKHKKIILPFGDFYFFDKFVVSEIHEGVHFDWKKVKQLIDYVYKHYSDNFNIAYVSNRVNSYSSEPQSWIKLRASGYDFIVAVAIVVYDEINFETATLEKLFANKSLKRCFSIEEAINWVLDLDEFKN